MARLMKAFPELVAMIKGIKVAARAVSSALLMDVMLIYIFGVVLHLVIKECETTDPTCSSLDKRWRGLAGTMYTLLMDGTILDGLSHAMDELGEANQTLAQVLMILFVLASAYTVMNMLIGVLCEVVTQVAEVEKEGHAVKMVKETLLVLLREMDEDGSGTISKDEIMQMLDNEACLAVLHSLGVDLGCLLEQMDMIFEE